MNSLRKLLLCMSFVNNRDGKGNLKLQKSPETTTDAEDVSKVY